MLQNCCCDLNECFWQKTIIGKCFLKVLCHVWLINWAFDTLVTNFKNSRLINDPWIPFSQYAIFIIKMFICFWHNLKLYIYFEIKVWPIYQCPPPNPDRDYLGSLGWTVKSYLFINANPVCLWNDSWYKALFR